MVFKEKLIVLCSKFKYKRREDERDERYLYFNHWQAPSNVSEPEYGPDDTTCLSPNPYLNDSLSFSPFLVDILSHLSISDVLTCKLVNKRLYHVIKKNDFFMPRTEVAMSIEFGSRSLRSSMGDLVYVLIRMRVNGKESTFEIIDKKIVNIHFGSRVIVKEYAKNVTEEEALPVTRAYAFPGSTEAFQFILRPLLRRYHFCKLTLRTDGVGGVTIIDDGWLEILTELAGKAGTRCHTLKVSQLGSRLEKLSHTLDCQRVVVKNCDLTGQLAEVCRWSLPVCFKANTSRIGFDTIKDLIQLWESGVVSVRQLEIDHTAHWHSNEFANSLLPFCQRLYSDYANGIMNIYCKRWQDDRILHIVYLRMHKITCQEIVDPERKIAALYRIETTVTHDSNSDIYATFRRPVDRTLS